MSPTPSNYGAHHFATPSLTTPTSQLLAYLFSPPDSGRLGSLKHFYVFIMNFEFGAL